MNKYDYTIKVLKIKWQLHSNAYFPKEIRN